MSWMGNMLKAGIYSDGKNIKIDGHMLAHGGISGPVGTGDVYFLDPANGSDSRNGKTPDKAFATLAAAEDALTANQNDIIYYLAGSSGATIASALTWDKNYTHLIGVCAPASVGQRARIFNSGNLASLLTVSASGCSFQNIYIFQGGATAASGNVIVTGGRNYFRNVHFAGIGNATPAGNANAYSLALTGAAENLFEDCTIGIDTIKRTAANNHLVIQSDSKRNEFRNCRFLSWAEVNTYTLVKIAGGNDRWTLFDGCWFYNFWTNHVGTLLGAMTVTVTTTHDVMIHGNSALFGILEWDSTDAAGTWISSPAPAAATSGIAVKPAT